MKGRLAERIILSHNIIKKVIPVNISIAIPADKKLELDRLAAELDRSRSWIINTAVDSYLERQRLLREEIRAAVREADAHPDDVVQHEKVAADFTASLKAPGSR